MQNTISFYKYHGTGNDFILIDSYNDNLQLTKERIQEMCHRRYGIGADGLMILRKKESFDFHMDFYNSDGNPGSMCGNGGRCIVAFARDLGIIKKEAKFWAPDGEHTAIYFSHDKISLQMKNVSNYEVHPDGLFLDTGSPHLVVTKKTNDKLNVYKEGKELRNSYKYKPDGTNVNFLILNHNPPKIYTYERGVENETYSCGTGTVAAALSLAINENYKTPIQLKSKGGLLTIRFKTDNNNKFTDIWLEGPATKTFSGTYVFE